VLGLAAPTIAGAFAGATTNTPGLAAAPEASGDRTGPTVGYAVTYLYGVIGMLIAVYFALRNRKNESAVQTLQTRTIRVDVSSTPSIQQLVEKHGNRIAFSRVRHGEDSPILTATEQDTLRKNDLVTVVGPMIDVDSVTEELGHASSHQLENDRAYLAMRRITVSSSRVAGRMLGELGLASQFEATVSRVRRGDVDVVATDDWLLQLGDRVRVIAPRARMSAVSAFLGDSARGLSDITPVVLGIGMAVGIGLGLVSFRNFALGAAAGTLILGLVLGRIGRIGVVVTVMPYTAAQVLSELGMLVFLSQAGTRAGAQIATAFSSGTWLKLLVLGFTVTSLVGGGLYVMMRRVFRMNETQLAGVIGGAQTQPAVLAFANDRARHDARVALGYALIYPAAMIAKIFYSQLLAKL
jgi:putative transport protein